MMRRTILLIFSLLPLCSSAQGADPAKAEALFAEANAAYQADAFHEAIRLYKEVLDQGLASRAVYFNLGNAYHKQGAVAESILHYERALLLAPNDEDTRFNLAIVRSTRVIDNVEPMPDLFLLGGLRDFFMARSSQQWAYVSLTLIWLAVLLGAGFLFIKTPTFRRWTFFGGIVLVIFSLVALSMSLGRRSLESNSQEGIIFQPNVYVKDAPGGKTDLIILHEGIKVSLADSLDGWYNIRLEDGKVGRISGWVPVESLVKI